MQFIVIGRDGTDENALERRMAAREAHLETAKKMHESGNWLYAAAILDDNGKMAGSMIVCDFESREALEKQWLDNEAYVKGNVWETVEVKQAAVAPFWAPK
ncbi:YciI family protein [uncultured Desulfobacter sp.]|uniref:YciI family protein n=1 Tax=uncultured Desulfobacter sp. TaxID=240139 RepID=UPI0029F4B536|nr:YciI family protein [uncultured Desulfobacter sp.]